MGDPVVVDRLVSDFLSLVRISSPSRREGEVARWLTARCRGWASAWTSTTPARS
jgi:hypothetical protein